MGAVAPRPGVFRKTTGSGEGQRSIGAGRVGADSSGARVGMRSLLPERRGIPPASAGWALAIGAIAVGQMAVGRLAIGRFALREARIGRLVVDEIEVGRMRKRGRRKGK